MSGCVLIQTNDSYSRFWPGLFWSMKRHWDREISWPIYFCNEEVDVPTCPFQQLKVGKGPYIERLARALDALQEYEYVFYMLEDFWPTEDMPAHLFRGLFDNMSQHRWDHLRVSVHMPAHYILEPTRYSYGHGWFWKFAKESKWWFSQHAAFWRRDFFRSCLVPAQVSEEAISSSLGAEIACDEYMRAHYPDAQVYLYHHFWYPVSGVCWRGQLTQIGEQIEYVMKVEELLESGGQGNRTLTGG